MSFVEDTQNIAAGGVQAPKLSGAKGDAEAGRTATKRYYPLFLLPGGCRA